MSDFNPNAVSLEDAPVGAIDGPGHTPEPEPQVTADADAEPEGVVEHQGRRMVDVSVLAAERHRAREATARAKDAEFEPLRQKAAQADQLAAVLAEVRPIIEDARRYGIAKPQPPARGEDLVTEDEATAEARDLELYDAKTGQPDIARARRIIARRRSDVTSAAQQAAQAAVGPITSATAQDRSRQNFAQVAMRRDPQNNPLVDSKALAEMWVQLPPELTAHAEVAELILDAAIGKNIRTKGHVARAERAPTFSEPAGGRVGPQYEMDRMAKSLAKNAGISDADFKKSAGSYTPGAVNTLGD